MGKVLTVVLVDLALLVYLYKLEPWLYFLSFFVCVDCAGGICCPIMQIINICLWMR